ncbi:hypothetical protein DFH07DRAFT_781831 [Mycena maculata]|uniref:Uncharacterized protein n=1 Tax=Mycena maculata TaxID=230809 RepID=A0AAD7HWG2_9AGAR|nr:hypothetical protein DFH07DRAFT_781831 [Mycena maculata]
MPPKCRHHKKDTFKSAKAPPGPSLPGKTCDRCGKQVLMNLFQHDRICRIQTRNRQVLVDHHENSSSPRDPVAMEIDEIMQLPTQQIYDEMPPNFDLDEDLPDVDVTAVPTVSLPQRFIYVKHHPHANKPDEIVSLDNAPSLETLPSENSRLAPLPDARPWAPFKTYSDYKFTSRCVQRRTTNTEIYEDLNDLRIQAFSSDCFITFRNHRDMEKSLAAARTSSMIVHQFLRKTLKINFNGSEFGGTYEVEIEFRDPWQIMKQWVTDETLAPDSLPADDLYPSCYLGLHVWLDKGLVSTKVKMHPILFRGCWIHSKTRNGSGNGGSALAGFVKMPTSLRQIDPNTITGSARSEYDRLKRLIYRGVCHLVMASLEQRSHKGEALRFGDGVKRVAYLGTTFLNLPDALAAAPIPKTDHNEHLKKYGLHDFEHFLWKFNNSDPYKGTGYDCLHFFDGGIWGRHMWPLIKVHLQRSGLASDFNANMADFPRWRDLKHLSSPTTIDYSDGQTFLNILKMSIMDENEETMARLDMKVSEWTKSQEDDLKDPVLPSHVDTAHWNLGSADPRMSSVRIETLNRGKPLYRDFNMRLREYLATHHPNHPIEQCKVLYVEFQSIVDWDSGRDILRCNPMFHGRSRYDSIIYEGHGDDLTMGQLELVFRCHLPHKATLDLAMIRPYRKSSWAARTRTDCVNGAAHQQFSFRWNTSHAERIRKILFLKSVTIWLDRNKWNKSGHNYA